jgi:GR25 family glycosyltransferase involved in LPS biosynthesis
MGAGSRTRIKLIGNFCPPEQLCRQWERMSQGQLRWNDIEITWEDRDVDLYVIVNTPWPGEQYVPSRTIVFQMEPWCGEPHQTWGVKTWGEWATPDPARFLQVRTHRTHLNNAFWQLKATYEDLRKRPILKTQVLASICGAKYFDPGHIRRVDFLKFLEQKDDDIVRVDLYARDNPLGFTSWVGPLPLEEKEAALTPYRYFFAAENNRERNFVTEKLWEPLLTETLCFYWGCPNAADWVDPRAFIPIDLDNFEQAFRTMREAILGNEWEKRVDVIRREKRKVLEHYQFFPTLERILRHELRLPRHPTDAEVVYHKYFSDALGAPIGTAAFLHSFTRGHDTTILAELLTSVETSGLLSRLDRLYIFNSGDEAVLPHGFDRHAGRIRLIDYSRDASGGEAPTLDLLRIFAAFHDGARILYLHTKGASYALPSRHVADWRRLMLHFLVERHAETLTALGAHDVVGCNLLDRPQRHFSGNFWWANARYLKTLPPVPTIDRHKAEWWVMGGDGVRAVSVHDSGVDHYREPYGRQAYASADAFAPASEPANAEASGEAHSSLCLVMIAKDEAPIVTEALASMLPYITDFVVVDTGSTDGTQEVIRNFFATHGIPGLVLERPWRDFGWNRTEALALARKLSTSEYLWMLDADDLLEGSPDVAHLTADAYHLRFGPDTEYWRLQIFRRALPWKYIGVLHEYPTCEAPASRLGRIEGGYQMHSRRLGSRNRDQRKYENDAIVLQTALVEEPENTRHAFYLAQSWFDARQFDKALEAYRRRASMGAWPEEVFYARYRAAACLEQLGRPIAEVRAAYEECFRDHPHRAEPLVRAAALARKADSFLEAYVLARRAARVPKPGADALFVETADYEFRALDEQAIAAYYCDFPDEAFDLCTELLDRRKLPDEERPRIEQNRDYAVPQLKDAFLLYDAELVARLASRPAPSVPRVTLSITSCRRLPLFIGTICSFLNACTDIDLIDRFLCIDDNSSAADRAEMQRRFPFFEFIFKGPGDKGHARSLNLIRESVRSPWLVHLEDDWHFFAKRAYIGPALEILEENSDIGQVLFNRNYAETLADREIPGGFSRRSAGHGHRYVMHEHYVAESDEHRRFQERHRRSSNAWWPHYSLRPAVLRVSVFEQVGPFDERAAHFEHDYAQRYVQAGFHSSFLDGVFALHTGRLTSERGDTARANAYDLNEQPQFAAAPRALLSPEPAKQQPLDERDILPGSAGAIRGHHLAKQLGLKVINLDRRTDRLESFRHHVAEVAGPDLTSRVQRFAAIDGRTLSLTPEIQHLFRGNNFSYRRGFVGCALSHLALWEELAAGAVPGFLILEDDVTLCPGFEGQMVELCGELEKRDLAFDLLLLGCFDWHPRPEDDFETGCRLARLRPFEGSRYIGGLFGYVVSRRGAQKLIAIVRRDGIQSGIDRFVHHKETELELLVASPHVVRSRLVAPGSGLDSDIQNDFDTL